MATSHLSARIPQETARRIQALSDESSKTRTQVVNELLDLGLRRMEDADLDEGFALLGDPEMQDRAFPTAPHRTATRGDPTCRLAAVRSTGAISVSARTAVRMG